MRTIKITSISIMLSCIYINIHAQMTVSSNGNANISGIVSTIKVGGESVTGKAYIGNPNSGWDVDNVVSLAIFGPYGTYRSGAKLSFGDIGSYTYNSLNTFIGEYGTSDSDQLWLQGKNGIRWTNGGKANELICRSYYSNGYKFKFYVPAYTQSGILVGSDSKFKENVKNLDNCLNKLKQLEGISYNHVNEKLEMEPIVPDSIGYSDTNIASEKELLSKLEDEGRQKTMEKKGRDRYGYIAQDLQKVFPNLVQSDDEGYLYVDYIGLIPVIVESLKEQQSIVDAQSLKIKELESKIERLNEISNKDSNIKSTNNQFNNLQATNITNAFLYQNIPNPFITDTKIEYFIPERPGNVNLFIFDLQGKLLISKNLTSAGAGSITINGSALDPGMYIYSLIIDGNEVDSKRMILTE